MRKGKWLFTTKRGLLTEAKRDLVRKKKGARVKTKKGTYQRWEAAITIDTKCTYQKGKVHLLEKENNNVDIDFNFGLW